MTGQTVTKNIKKKVKPLCSTRKKKSVFEKAERNMNRKCLGYLTFPLLRTGN